MGFLAGLGAIGGLLGGAGSLLSATRNSESPGLMKDYQADRLQGQLDRANPREIDRQRKFMSAITPHQAALHNQTMNKTFGQDTRHIQNRMDTLFEGTSPWERLGSPAATIGADAPTGPKGDIGANNQFMAQAMQMNNAKEIAKINAKAQLGSAALSAGSSMAGSGPQAEQAKASSQQALNSEEANNIREAELKLKNKEYAEKIRAKNIDTVADIVKLLPERKYDMFFQSASKKEGYREAITMLVDAARSGGVGGSDATEDVAKKFPDAFKALTDDVQKIAQKVKSGMSLKNLLGEETQEPQAQQAKFLNDVTKEIDKPEPKPKRRNRDTWMKQLFNGQTR